MVVMVERGAHILLAEEEQVPLLGVTLEQLEHLAIMDVVTVGAEEMVMAVPLPLAVLAVQAEHQEEGEEERAQLVLGLEQAVPAAQAAEEKSASGQGDKSKKFNN
jgi:hypothetical protein